VVGADAAGAHYRGALQASGVSPAALTTSPSAAPSALSLSLLTPGGARARRFCPGAAAEAGAPAAFAPAAEALLRTAQLLHCEGASLRRGGALLAAIRLASSGGAVVSLELGEAERLAEAAAALRAALATGAVDLVFASEAAAAALGGLQPAPGLSAVDAGVSHLLRSCAAVCITRGGLGSVTTRKDGERFATPPARRGAAAAGGRGAVEDSAADDAHAAGFLWALLHGAPLPVCAATGAAAKAEALAARGGGRLGAFALRRLLAQWEAAAGADIAAEAAAELAPPPGLLASLGAWLFPEDAPGKEPAHNGASAAASAARLARPATGASAGQLWGGEIDYSAAAEEGGGALVEAYNEKGERVMMRRTLSGRLLPAPAAAAGGGANPPPYADGAMHRSLSSRVAGTRGGMADSDSSASLAEAEAAAAGGCAAPQAGSPWAAWVAHYLGLGWLSSWVDSRALFAAPEQAPTRMRRSMSSRVMTARNLTRVGEGRDATRVWEQAPAPDE